jgi:two-component system response regulator AtoC
MKIIPLAQLEKEAIMNALQMLNGDKVGAAKMLGIGKTTLYRKLKEYEREGSNVQTSSTS